jgi:hypothetical protein
MFLRDRDRVRSAWPALLETLADQRLLYVPTAQGGSPQRALAARNVLRVLDRLLVNAPRLGLITETYRLLETIHQMEQRHPAGPGAITDFGRLFEKGCRGIVDCLVASSEAWQTDPKGRTGPPRRSDRQLVEELEKAVEMLLKRWLAHSRNIRISVLEAVADNQRWRVLREFIQRYGRDLFTQQALNIGNLRAILHQGVDRYLSALAEEPDPETDVRLLRELGGPIGRDDAVRWLELTIRAVVDNYPEYMDYNSTTTQSDRGEMLYTLLDFLRLRASYDRVAWKLKPFMIAHEVMVRRGRVRAADRWRKAVVQRTRVKADEYLERFETTCRKHAMRLASVADRLNERFVRPLDIDRLRALVRPAIAERRSDGGGVSFKILEEEVVRFVQEPAGVGLDWPSWLEALEEEVERACADGAPHERPDDLCPETAQVRLALEEVQRELDSWEDSPEAPGGLPD